MRGESGWLATPLTVTAAASGAPWTGSRSPDGRAYVYSFLLDTDLHFANMVDGQIVLNKNTSEFVVFTKVLTRASCGDCKVSRSCMGSCPAEELVMGAASCASDPGIVPLCRLRKADIPTRLFCGAPDRSTVASRPRRCPRTYSSSSALTLGVTAPP